MNPVKLILLAVCVVLAAADTEYDNLDLLTSSENQLAARIVGGEDAEEGQFPYQISLRTTLQRAHFCGGSILTKRFLLTAAHCTQGAYANPRNIYAVVGALRRLSGGVSVKLNKITAHEKYNPYRILNDVSLLRTAEEITFTDVIQPIALPSADLPADSQVLLSGWGRTSVSYCFSTYFLLDNPFIGNTKFTTVYLCSTPHQLANHNCQTFCNSHTRAH